MLRAVLNKSWRQYPKKQQLYGHLPPITKTIQVRWTRHAGHCRSSKDELISDVLLWTPSHGRTKFGRITRTYIQQLCANTGCRLEDITRAMDEWRERVRETRHDNHDELFALERKTSNKMCPNYLIKYSPVDWDSRIHWLHLYRKLNPSSNECPRYDIKWSDGDTPTMKIWGMPNISSLPLLPSQFCPR